jgi:chemotaxis protein CheZ
VDDLDARLTALVCDRLRTEITPLFDELHRFVDRRIAELSAEVHGTAQLLDFSETNLSSQLSRIHEQIASVVAAPIQASRNSGLELEAVLQATETAANQIMGAAEVIGDWVRSDRREPADLAMVAEKVNTIFEACTFQDVTGQRIRRAIQHLQRVETTLSDMMSAKPSGSDQIAVAAVAVNQNLMPGPNLMPDPDLMQGPDLMQDEVDRLFNSAATPATIAADLGQGDVDRMFD